MYSAKLRIRTDYVQNDGRSSIFLDVRVAPGPDGRKKIPLEIFWPVALFDAPSGKCLPQGPQDEQCEANNLLLGQKLGRANDVFVEYRLRKQPLTIERFLYEFENPLSKTDFLLYFEQKLTERLRLKVITQSSYDVQARALTRVREFAGGKLAILPFFSLDRTWAQKFDTWLKNTYGNGLNTRWARHKDVTTYLHLAELDEIQFVNPYLYFKKKSTDGSWKPLRPESIQKLYAYYPTASGPERCALQKYLVACAANLRISDLNRACRHNLIGDELVYVQHKNRRFNRIHRLPLTPTALSIIQEALREHPHREKIFGDQSEQAGNRILKRIAHKLEIPERIHFHSGRETFGTEFIANGGQLPVLKELMGHAKISSTMRYVHVREEQKREQVILVDKMFSA
jgi:integrase